MPDSNKARAGKRKVPRRITADYLHNAGLYYLQRFAASRARFEDVLMRKAMRSCRHHNDQDMTECAEMIRATATKFAAAGLLNDEAYAAGLVASLRRAGKSRRAILAKLTASGLEPALAAQALASRDEEDGKETDESPDVRAARIFARRKRLGPFRPGPPAPEKDLAALARAGFGYDAARAALQSLREHSKSGAG